MIGLYDYYFTGPYFCYTDFINETQESKMKTTKLSIGLKIQSKEAPCWGVWNVVSNLGEGLFTIRGSSGERVISQTEFERFWEVA